MIYLLGTTEEIRAKLIREKRKRLRLTQQLAAEECGIPLRTFQRAEDKAEKVDMRTARSIADGLEIPLKDLVGVPVSEHKNGSRLRLFSLISALDEEQVDRFLDLIQTELGIMSNDEIRVSFEKRKQG